MKLLRAVASIGLALVLASAVARADPPASSLQPPGPGSGRDLPELTAPVNDFAHVIDAASAAEIERVIRTLETASNDVIVVATVETVEPYADAREYANKLFENHGRGIGGRGKDNGLLVLLSVRERRVQVEVGYGLEQWITDGYAGETSRDFMAPEFRNGRYGAGLLAGVTRIAGRIAEGRNVPLTGVELPRERPTVRIPLWAIILLFLLIVWISRRGGGPGRPVARWGRRGWSGWTTGVGPFGGGVGGGGFGGRGGGFGGGFGGFGGGRSGGGGGGAGW